MLPQLAWRLITTTRPRLLWKFAYQFGYQGLRSVRRFQKGLRKGEVFPPFLYLSITSGCNLRCQGCWVDVDRPRQEIAFDVLDRLVRQARAHGNRFFGILGGEPFMHPDLLRLLAAHRDCYFQVFTNGHFLTDRTASELARLGNATPLVSIEGSEAISDERRGRPRVFDHTLAGLAACARHGLVTGVATSVCQSNFTDLVSESWLRRLIDLRVHYVWYYIYRPVGPRPQPELALRPEQVLDLRRFLVNMRRSMPIVIVDAYWDDQGRAICPMATGISHHVGPAGDVEPCPIIQFAAQNIHDNGDVRRLLAGSEFLADFRRTAAGATRGCIVLERPDLVADLVRRHQARDTTSRQTALAEVQAMQPRASHHAPGQEIPEAHWFYRFAKRHWFFGFSAYG